MNDQGAIRALSLIPAFGLGQLGADIGQMALPLLHPLLRAHHFALGFPRQIVLRQFQQEATRLRPHQFAVLTALATQGEDQLFCARVIPT